MATKRKPGSRPGLIRCDYCGEEYSSSYRRCPFCAEFDEYKDDYDDDSPVERKEQSSRNGGKRLAPTNKRGGGYGRQSAFQTVFTALKIIISLAIIAAAIWVVVTQLKPLIDRANGVDTIDPDTGSSQSSDSSSGSSDSSPDNGPHPGGFPDDTPDTSPSPSTPVSTATGFTLNKTDFSFSNRYPDPITLVVTFTPAGTTGTITWSSSDSAIASVDENGKVSHGTKSGTATITAELDNGVKQTCLVRNSVTSSTSTTEPSTSPTTGTTTYKVNNADFTFYRAGETYTLKVVDYSGSVTWSSSDSGVVTVDSNGKCTAVSTGNCTVTGTLDNGSTVKAKVYVRIS